MTEFLLAVWRSRYGMTTAKKLHKEVRRVVKKAKAATFLDASSTTRSFLPTHQRAPNTSRSGHARPKEAVASLKFFRDFGIKQPMPLLLSLMREYDAKRITVTQLTRTH